MAAKKPPVKKGKVADKPGKAGKKKKETQQEILDYVVDVKLQGREISCRTLAKDKGINKETAARYIKKANLEILKYQPFDYDVEREEQRLIHQRLKRRYLYWLDQAEEENNPLADKAFMREMRDSMKDYTEFLEKWNFKDKVADKHEVTADITQRSLHVEVVTHAPDE
jgi:hypothetical protein